MFHIRDRVLVGVTIPSLQPLENLSIAHAHHESIVAGVHYRLQHPRRKSILSLDAPCRCSLDKQPLQAPGFAFDVDYFKYLGSVIDQDGTIDRDADLRAQAAWSSCRKLTGVLYVRKIPIKYTRP